MTAGEGGAHVDHTVAEDVHLQLAGSDYSSFVDMGSLNVTFLPGVTTRYVFAASVLHGTVDWPVRVRVEARDQHNNLATSEQRGLWIAFSTSVVQVVDFSNGVGTALVSSTRPGPLEVTLRDPVHPTADISSTVTVHFAVGVVQRYAFVSPASSDFVAGNAAVISLVAEDQFGNLVEAESRGVQVLTSKGSGGGSVTFTNGRSSTSVTHTVAELVVLSLSDHLGTGLDVSSTLTIRFIGGVAFTVSLGATPNTGTVDAPLVVSLTALDRFLNLAAAATQAVQVVAPGTSVSGGGPVSFVGGRATASISSQRDQTVQVSLLDLGAGLDCSATVSLDFVPGAPRAFALEAPASGTTGTPVTIVVKALDQYGNTATSASQSVTVQASGAGQLSNGGVVSLSSGTASALLSNTQAERVELTLQDTFLTGLTASSRAEVVFGAAAAARYVLGFATAQTSSSVDGTVSVSVTALDQYGNTAIGEQRGVGLRTNASAASTTSVAVSNGVGTASVGHTVPEMLTLSLVDTQSTGLDVSSTLMVRFTAGQVRSLAFQPGPSITSSVDATLSVAVLALDQYGNVATGASSIDVDISLTGTQVGGAGRLTLAQGRGTASVTSQRPQSVQVSFVDTYATGLDVSAVLSLAFTTGAPSRVAMTTAASGVVGSSVSVALNSFDQYGNQVATGSASISVLVSGSASVSNSGLAQLQNGAASLTVQNTKAETVALSMQDSFSSGLDVSDSQSLVFRAGPAARYSFVSTRLQGSVDNAVQVDVQALDQFGNLATDQSVDVGFSSSAGGATTMVDISVGRGSSQVRHTVAEALTLTLVDSLSTGLDVSTDGSLEITFAASSAQRIVLQAGVSSGTVDAPLQVSVRALDSYGNLATAENRAVELRKGGVTSLGRVDLVSGEGLVSVPSTTVGSVTLTVHDSYGMGVDCTATLLLTFTGGASSRLALIPQSGQVGDLVNLTVNALDQYGNEASPTSASTTVRASGSAVVLNNGIVTISQSSAGVVALRNTKAETVTLSMEDSFSTGLDVSDTKTMVFLANPATRFSFASVPSQASVDTGAQITVHALDQYDNVATTQQADVGVQLSSSISPSIVDIAAGRGTLQVTRTVPQVVSLMLVDSQGTGLSVAGGSANVTFIPGAARSLVFQPSTVTGTVDAPVAVELLALDQHGNLATAEGRAVEVRTSSSRTSGLGRVDFTQGRASFSIASQLAQSVQVTIHDTYSTGMDCTASGVAVFGHGELRSFRLTDSAGASRIVAKVGRTVIVHTRAEDRYGNLVTNLTSVAINGEIRPAPTNGSNASLTWGVNSGIGTQDIYTLTAGVFSVLVVDASGQASQAGLLSSAADRSLPWHVEFRQDLVPPDYGGLNISSITQTEVVINVNGLTETSTLWCIAADAASNPPLTPSSTSDGEVYTALRGSGNVTTTPEVRGGPFVSGGQLTLTGLQAGRTYAIRCAAADEDGNQMTGQRILYHQLAATAPQNPAPVEADDSGPGVMFILGIVGICIASLIFCCAAAYFLRARNLLKKVRNTVTGIMPAWDSGNKNAEAVVPEPAAGDRKAEPGADPSQQPGQPAGSSGSLGVDKAAAAALAGEIDRAKGADSSPSLYSVEDPTPKFGADRSPLTMEEADTDDGEGERDDELLRDALAMQQELMDELQKRGDLEDDHDSTESDDSDTEAIVRDVKAFLRQQMLQRSREDGGAPADGPALVMPDLPLLLSIEDEARLSALITLGQQGGASWSKHLANFDELWRDAQGPAWLEAREVVRAEMQHRNDQIEATRKRVMEAKEAVEQHSEASETAILDALAAEEEAVASEADERLKTLHQLAIDWPEEDATQRNAVVTEWAQQITSADHLPKAERAQIRKEAIEALRKLDSQREAALEAELELFAVDSAKRFEAMQEDRAEAWRKMCEASAQQAAKLREEVARLQMQVAAMGRQAEEAALQAALRLRRRLRDDAIEAEMGKEAEERERQLGQWRAAVQELSAGDAEETAALRERALAMLDRAASHASKVASDEQARRKRHWHEILEERSREWLKALRRRYQDGERRLGEEAVRAQEEAAEAESHRRVVLVLGALHRTEAATLAVSSSARRGRILMGLQATAAGSVAEERLPRREQADRRSSGQVEREKTEALGTTGMGATGLRWQDAKRKAAEELNAALDQVAEILSEHGQRQRALLAQRQRREASLAAEPEGDDERREDLLDALEENMRREFRAARWQHDGEAAKASAHRGAGEESELGRRLATVNRDSQLLSTEDEIGERYDRLRALAMGPGAEEEYAAQRQAQTLEREAAALRAEAMVSANLVGSPQTAWDSDSPKADLQGAMAFTESPVEAVSDSDEGNDRKTRQRRRQESLQRARALIREEQLHEALEVLRTSLEEESAFEEASVVKSADPMILTIRSVVDTWPEQQDATNGEAQQSPNEHSARQARRQDAFARVDALEAAGRSQEAAQVLLDALEEVVESEAAPYASERSLLNGEGRQKLMQSLHDGQGNAIELLALASKDQRARLEARRRRRQEALQKAKELEAQGQSRDAAQIAIAALNEERADELREDAGEVPRSLDWKMLQDELAARGQKIDGAIEQDAEARKAKFASEREVRRRNRMEQLEKAKKLQSHGFVEQAYEVAAQELEKRSQEDDEEMQAMVVVARQSIGESSLSEEEQTLFMSALSTSYEAIEREKEAQRQKLEARRQARRQHREELVLQAERLSREGRHKEAAELIAEAMSSDEVAAEVAEAEGAGELEWTHLKSDFSRRQDLVSGHMATMAKDAEARKQKFQRLREERMRRREEATSMARDLEEQGLEKEAAEVMIGALKEDEEASDGEHEVREAAFRPTPGLLSEADRSSILDTFAEGEAARGSAVARGAEDHKQKVEDRRRARQQKREEAEKHAAELERQAAEVRAAAAEKAKAARSAAAGAETAAKATKKEFDAVTEWQEAARRRAAVGAVATFCQRGQEDAARRLLDTAESNAERSALKDGFAAEMEKCGQAVAEEREVQRRRARERLDERRKKREVAAAKTQDQSRSHSFGTAALKVRKAVQNQIHGVHGLKKIHARRRQRIVEEHREVERRVRDEMDKEMEALRQQLHHEAENEIRKLQAAGSSPTPPDDASSEDKAKKAREAGMARASEVKDLIQTERQRQAERIEARLAQRRNKLRKREAAVVQSHQWVEARVELDQERERLQAKPVSKAKNKQLMKELHKVNNIIASLQQGGTQGSPSNTGQLPSVASPLQAARPRLVDIDGDQEGSEEEV